MVDVRSLYKPSSPQQPMVKRRRLRLSSVPLVDLRSTSLPGTSAECAKAEARFSSSSGSLAKTSHITLPYLPKTGLCSQGMENVKGTSSVRARYLSSSVQEGQSRFPKLDECAHFHYEFVELGDLQLSLHEEPQETSKTGVNVDRRRSDQFSVDVSSGSKIWCVRRTYANFCFLDEQLHRCIYDRKFSLLPELTKELLDDGDEQQESVRTLLAEYLERFSSIAGNLINCGPVLNWLELDNRGNHLIVTDDSAINTPAVAAAYVIKRYMSQATDEISFEVGDMISVIDMPPSEESIWWRGKRGFEVGFFPCECVELIGDKVPHSISIPKTPMKPVFRKHGKLISFFRSFILSRPSRRKLKQRGILKERVFGCDLGEHLLNSGHEIPMVLKCCSEFIEQHGIVDGIYRLSGITSNIQKLRIAFDEDRVPNLSDTAILQDIHCVASLLKMYFRELPNPLLTYQLYDKFVHAVQSSENMRLMTMRDVVQQLPPPHYRTLEFLVKHLAKVASHGADTGMTPKNVAIVWAPNLLRSKELEIGSVAALQVVGTQAIVTEYLIRYVDLIFNEKLPLFSSIFTNEGSSVKGSRPKSLAISSSSKLLSLEEAQSRACGLSLQTKPKYIEVGGGPANLPSQYHTVIDLVDRKRVNLKLKKSPSTWKSIFSKGRSHSQSSKDKRKNLPKQLGSTALQSSLLEQEEAFPEMSQSAFATNRRLRSVKSAESLSSQLAAHTAMTQNSIGTADTVDLSESLQVASSAPSRMSVHSHMRSFSHDSYFEISSEIPQHKLLEDQDGTIFNKDKGKSLDCLIMDDFEDVALDMNQITMNYDRDFDILSTGTSEMVDSSETRGGSSLQSPLDVMHGGQMLLLDDFSHRQFETVELKSAFTFEEKLKQTLDRNSCAFASEMEDSVSSGHNSDSTSQRSQSEERKCSSPSQSPKSKQQKWNSAHEEKLEWGGWQEYVGSHTQSTTATAGSSPITSNSMTGSRVAVEVHVTQDAEDEMSENGVFNVDLEELLPILSSPPCFIDEHNISSVVTSCDVSSSNAVEQNSSECQTLEPSSQDGSSQFSSILDTPTSITEPSPQSDSQLSSILATGDSDSIIGCSDSNDIAAAQPIIPLIESNSSVSLGVSWLWDAEGSKEEDCFARQLGTPQGGMETSTSTGSMLSSKGDGAELLSPMERFDSESSTPSVTTLGESGICTTDEKGKSPPFGYKILVDEVESTDIAENLICQKEEENLVSVGIAVGRTEQIFLHDDDVRVFCTDEPFYEGDSKLAEVNNHRLGVSVDRKSSRSLHHDESEEKLHFADRLSPMDESRRKFESEIGRDILHERKMKLELEKIQSEQKCDRSCVVLLETKLSPRALPPLSDISGGLINKFLPMKHDSKVSKETEFQGQGASSLNNQEVELRHRRNSAEELKRKSESSIRREHVHNAAELKRHSEPSRAASGIFSVKTDKITGSIKQLMTKFEGSSCSSGAVVTGKPPSQPRQVVQPLEATLLDSKVLEAQKSIIMTVSDCDSKIPTAKERTECQRRPSPCHATDSRVFFSDAKPAETMERNSEINSSPSTEDLMSRSLPSDPLSFVESPTDPNSVSFISNDKGAKPRTVKETADERNIYSKSLPFLTDPTMNDAARRERINRYKEERRAQLREKIRSESFKMDKEEKSEYLSRLKQKSSGANRSTDDQNYSFRRRRTMESKSSAAADGICEALTNLSDGASKETSSTCWLHDHPKKLERKPASGEFESTAITSLDSIDQENMSHLTCSFLRTIPGRRGKKSGSDIEPRSLSPGRAGSLKERNSLPMTLDGPTTFKPLETKEILVKKPTSLPTKQRLRTFSERKFSSKVQSPSQESHSTSKHGTSVPSEDMQRLRPRCPSWRDDSSRTTFKDPKTEGPEFISPTCKIKEVAALFEKESLGAKSKVPFTQPPTLARTRYLAGSADRGAERDSFRKKPAQYTSAV